MLLGEYQHAIDGKGRLFIPSRLREGIGEVFILTKGLDKCLFGYAREEWSKMEANLQSLPFTRADARAFMRLFFAGASEVELDRQGRVLVPPALRAYAGLEREVVVLGVGTRLEVWSLDAWQSYSTEAEKGFNSIAESLFNPGVAIQER